MENKINIAELLKDCPKGMELDCTMYDNVVFDGVSDNTSYPIDVLSDTMKLNLTKTGGYSNSPDAKCVIFPKGKTTWEGFVPPCKFKDGDVLTCMYLNEPTIYIYRENDCCNTSFYAAYSLKDKHFY